MQSYNFGVLGRTDCLWFFPKISSKLITFAPLYPTIGKDKKWKERCCWTEEVTFFATEGDDDNVLVKKTVELESEVIPVMARPRRYPGQGIQTNDPVEKES